MQLPINHRFPADPVAFAHRINDEVRLWSEVWQAFIRLPRKTRSKVFWQIRKYVHSCDELDVAIEARTVMEIIDGNGRTDVEKWAEEPMPDERRRVVREYRRSLAEDDVKVSLPFD